MGRETLLTCFWLSILWSEGVAANPRDPGSVPGRGTKKFRVSSKSVKSVVKCLVCLKCTLQQYRASTLLRSKFHARQTLGQDNLVLISESWDEDTNGVFMLSQGGQRKGFSMVGWAGFYERDWCRLDWEPVGGCRTSGRIYSSPNTLQVSSGALYVTSGSVDNHESQYCHSAFSGFK